MGCGCSDTDVSALLLAALVNNEGTVTPSGDTVAVWSPTLNKTVLVQVGAADRVNFSTSPNAPTGPPPAGVATWVTSAGVRFDWDGAAWRNTSATGETPLILQNSASVVFAQSGASGHTATASVPAGPGLIGPTLHTSHAAWPFACSPDVGSKTGVDSGGRIVGSPPHFVRTSNAGVCTGPIAVATFGAQATASITNPSTCRSMRVQAIRMYWSDITSAVNGQLIVENVVTVNGAAGVVDAAAFPASSPTASIRNASTARTLADGSYLIAPGATFTYGVNSVGNNIGGANTINDMCHQVYLLGITEGVVGE